MSKKNRLPVKWMIWLVIVLSIIVFWQRHVSKIITRPTNTAGVSQNNTTSPSSMLTGQVNENGMSSPGVQGTNNAAAGENNLPSLGNANPIQNNPSGTSAPGVNAANGKMPNPAGAASASGATNATAGNNAAGNNQAPTAPANPINPVPSDAAALQMVAKQDQRMAQAYNILASHEALAAVVMQASEASKNQSVNAQSIIPVSQALVPGDVLAKIKSNQVAVAR